MFLGFLLCRLHRYCYRLIIQFFLMEKYFWVFCSAWIGLRPSRGYWIWYGSSCFCPIYFVVRLVYVRAAAVCVLPSVAIVVLVLVSLYFLLGGAHLALWGAWRAQRVVRVGAGGEWHAGGGGTLFSGLVFTPSARSGKRLECCTARRSGCWCL